MVIDTGGPRIRSTLHDLPMCRGREASQSSLVAAQPCETSRLRASAQLPTGPTAGLPANTLAPRTPQCLFGAHHVQSRYLSFGLCFTLISFCCCRWKFPVGIFPTSRVADLPLPPFPRKLIRAFPTPQELHHSPRLGTSNWPVAV
jgi:hypothetical protein